MCEDSLSMIRRKTAPGGFSISVYVRCLLGVLNVKWVCVMGVSGLSGYRCACVR